MKTIENDVGLLTSPNYPADYDSSANCVWIIKAPEGSQIFLKFHTFKVQIISVYKIKIFACICKSHLEFLEKILKFLSLI